MSRNEKFAALGGVFVGLAITNFAHVWTEGWSARCWSCWRISLGGFLLILLLTLVELYRRREP